MSVAAHTLDLFTIENLRRFPSPEWLLTDHIHKQDVAVLYGPPGSGKSFLALDWALSIATGLPWLGHHHTAQAPILYMAGEGAPSICKRVNAWMAHHRVTDLSAAYFHLRPLPLREEEVIHAIESTLENFMAMDEVVGLYPGLLVVDTLSQFFSGGDEVSPDMTQFVNNMRTLSQATGMAILIVHHSNATGKRERGHSSLRGNVEVMFNVDAIEPAGQIIGLTLTNDKQKDDPRVQSLKLSLEPLGNSLVVSPANADLLTISGRVKKSGPPAPMRKVDMLTILGSHSEGMTFKEWELASAVPHTTFVRRLATLKAASDIYLDGGRWFAMPATFDLANLEE